MTSLLYAFTLALILPLSAQATSTAIIINTNCSGSLTSSLIDGASFACAGNLTLDGGFITSDSLINITADGDLFVDFLNLTAPNIIFSSESGLLKIGSNTVINSGSTIALISNKINLAEGSLLKVVKSDKVLLKPNTNLITSPGGNLSLENNNGLMPDFNSPSASIGGSIVIGSGGLDTKGGLSYNSPIVLSAVPEPSTYMMILLGLGFITYRRQFKQ